jgi:hypothetical protein
MTGLITSEREQLDLQRARLEDILNQDMVSQDMKGDLRKLLDDIGHRLHQLSQGSDVQAMMHHMQQ